MATSHCTACGQICQAWAGALQVFDKALTETTFCEIYADLCYQLNTALPSFEPPSQDASKRNPSTFRSALHWAALRLSLVPLLEWHNHACAPCTACICMHLAQQDNITTINSTHALQQSRLVASPARHEFHWLLIWCGMGTVSTQKVPTHTPFRK